MMPAGEAAEDDSEHGGLVRKILETKRELEGSGNQEARPKQERQAPILSDAARRKERELAQKEVEGGSTSDDGVLTSTQKEIFQSKGENVDHSANIETSDQASEASIDFFEEEAWRDSVKKCNCTDSERHHNRYIETSDPTIVESCIKEQILDKFNYGEVYYDKVHQALLKECNMEQVDFRVQIATEHNHQGFNKCNTKSKISLGKALDFFNKEVDRFTKKVVSKIKGVVRVQRKKSENREHGTGTGILVRAYCGGYFGPGVSCCSWKGEPICFAILTNNHVIANETEAKGATIDFFYDSAAGNETQGGPPKGVVTKAVKKIISFSPRVAEGRQVSNDQMDFSILTFEIGGDEKLLNDLYHYSFDLSTSDCKQFIPLPKPLLLLAISHPHGSNKRISFGTVDDEAEVDLLYSTDHEKCSTSYKLTTCHGSSGCPVFAIKIDRWGHLEASLECLHFKKNSGVRVYSICMSSGFPLTHDSHRKLRLLNEGVLGCAQKETIPRLQDYSRYPYFNKS